MLDQLASDVIAGRPLRQLRFGRLLLEIRLDVSPVRQLLVIGGSLVLGILISASDI